jgi:hypothetical protein
MHEIQSNYSKNTSTSIVKVPKKKRKRKDETQISFCCDGSYFDY